MSSRTRKKRDGDVDAAIINTTMQGSCYANANRERREALRVLAAMKEREAKLKAAATPTTKEQVTKGVRTSYAVERKW